MNKRPKPHTATQQKIEIAIPMLLNGVSHASIARQLGYKNRTSIYNWIKKGYISQDIVNSWRQNRK